MAFHLLNTLNEAGIAYSNKYLSIKHKSVKSSHTKCGHLVVQVLVLSGEGAIVYGLKKPFMSIAPFFFG